jgi:hypothetical protein
MSRPSFEWQHFSAFSVTLFFFIVTSQKTHLTLINTKINEAFVTQENTVDRLSTGSI